MSAMGQHSHDHHDGHASNAGANPDPHGHSHGQASVDRALEASSQGMRALKVSFAGLALTAALQAAVVVASGSVALLSDTLHNLSDAATAVPLWLAFRLARRAPSRRFTHGLGRAEDLAGLFVVVMIGLSAMFAGWQALAHLSDPPEVRHLGMVMVAGAVGAIGNEAVAMYRTRVGRRIGSAALVADGLHARTDGLTSLGVVVGAAGVAAGWDWADPVVGLAIAAAIVVMLAQAIRSLGERLLDGVDPVLVEQATAAAAAVDGVQDVSALRARWVGHRQHAEARVTVDRDLDVASGHDIAERVRDALLDRLPVLAGAVVHVDPCRHDGGDPHARSDPN